MILINEDGFEKEKYPILLSKEGIDRIFEEAKRPDDYMSALYASAYPQGTAFMEMKDRPEVSDVTFAYIQFKAMEFDFEYYGIDYNLRECDIWGSKGFKINIMLDDWRVDQAWVKPTDPEIYPDIERKDLE